MRLFLLCVTIVALPSMFGYAVLWASARGAKAIEDELPDDREGRRAAHLARSLDPPFPDY
ncbi:MAG: hypothetical protein H6760_01515 [Candidatus Nomurabacteria bacterium]|nr:MAG: hypothetical protein H6760_01515 [Candidatus Nomurabacteria bacterium]